jgi:hypothetical protein
VAWPLLAVLLALLFRLSGCRVLLGLHVTGTLLVVLFAPFVVLHAHRILLE